MEYENKQKVGDLIMLTYSENALMIYKKLYFRGNEQNYSETHERIANFVSLGNEELKNKVYTYLNNQNFRFNTPIMMNAGYSKNPQTSACFVGSLSDDLQSIFNFDMDCGLIYKEGSGVGINYGRLRETNAPLSQGGNSSGPFSFIRKSASTCWAVKSGGVSRRAAFMCMMFDYHPDLLDFISFKQDHKEEIVILSNQQKEELFSCMNFSIAVSNNFMEAVFKNLSWDLIGVVDKKIKSTHNANFIFHEICKNAYECGDPGIWFIDRANEDNTLPSIGNYAETNPCGEQHLHAYQSCALASINLASIINEDKSIDFNKLQDIIWTIVDSLDNIIDISGYPSLNFKNMAINTRPIGIGPMGVADCLIKLNLSYDSDKGIEIIQNLCRFITQQTIIRSSQLAKDRGVFSLYNENKESVNKVIKKFFNPNDPKLEEIYKYGVRHSQWTTCAPSGTTGISCDCSLGIEPLFAICYDKVLSDEKNVMKFINPIFENWLNTKFNKHSKKINFIINKIIENNGSIQGLNIIPQEIQNIYKVAHDISWEHRINLQSKLQQVISNAISSTINLSNDATIEDIEQIYKTAYSLKLKGITVYRDGCKNAQPINFGKKEIKQEIIQIEQETNKNITRPIRRCGETFEIKTPHGRLYCTFNKNKDGKPLEVFLRLGKSGTLENLLLDTISRLISKNLQNSVDYNDIVSLLRGIKEEKFWFKFTENNEQSLTAESIIDAVGIIMEEAFYNPPSKEIIEKTELYVKSNKEPFVRHGFSECPECHRYTLKRDTGCRGGQCQNPDCLFTNCS
jgi:ribonucleoside-diphosphate reductase alpha chain